MSYFFPESTNVNSTSESTCFESLGKWFCPAPIPPPTPSLDVSNSAAPRSPKHKKLKFRNELENIQFIPNQRGNYRNLYQHPEYDIKEYIRDNGSRYGGKYRKSKKSKKIENLIYERWVQFLQ